MQVGNEDEPGGTIASGPGLKDGRHGRIKIEGVAELTRVQIVRRSKVSAMSDTVAEAHLSGATIANRVEHKAGSKRQQQTTDIGDVPTSVRAQSC